MWPFSPRKTRRTLSARRRPLRYRPCLEALEDRTVPSTFTVTNTSDDPNQVGSLRWAINQVNTDSTDSAAQPDIINFNITLASDTAAGGTGFNANTGVATIQPQSILPTITNPVIIDGYTPGASANNMTIGDNAVLNIVLDGSGAATPGAAPALDNGLVIAGGNTTVEGLMIQNFSTAINLASGNNLVAGDSFQVTTPFLSAPWLGLTGAVNVSAGSDNTIGGTTPAARNLIGGGNLVGIRVRGGQGTLIEGNYIGTDASGSTGIWDGSIGVWVNVSDTTIGGTSAAAANLISGWNQSDVQLGGGSNGTVVEGNYIGTDASGSAALAGGVTATGARILTSDNTIGGTVPGAGNTIAFCGLAGVLVQTGTSGNSIEGNAIDFNDGPGVWVAGDQFGSSVGNSIEANAIYANADRGIALGTGPGGIFGPDPYSTGTPNGLQTWPNNSQIYPVLTSATSSSTDTVVTGTFSEAAEPNTTLTIDFYANPVADPSGYGQGQTYLGSTTVTTDGNGNATFSVDFAVGNLGGQWVTATATDPGGNTSEFSADTPILATNETFTQFLQGVLPQSSTTANSITIVAGPSTMPATVIGAVNALTNVTQPVTVTLDLGGGTYSSGGVAANPPPNVTFVVQNGTLDPNNPALTVAGGQVSVLGCTLTTSGNAPTLLVTGGNVTLLNDNIIQASTVFTDPAIAVTGGTVNLGTAAVPGNNTLSVNSSGDLVTNTTGSPISAVGDTFKVGGTVETAPSLSFTSLATSAASIVVGQPVTLTATVAPDMPGSATPTGTIDFYDTTTNTDLGKVTLSGGVASLTTSALGVGTHVIQASYAGDGTYLPSLYTITQSVTYNITLLSNLSHSQPAGSQFTFQVEPTNAAGTNLSATVGSVTAVGYAPASNPIQITPVPDGGAFTPLANSKKPTSWQYILQTSKSLASGTYVFYFTIQGDPVTHSLTFQVK
jgi:hypothetical protein